MPYPVDSIDPGKAALIVVDMENDFIATGAPCETPAGRAMLPTLKCALAFCREQGIRVIYTIYAPHFKLLSYERIGRPNRRGCSR